MSPEDIKKLLGGYATGTLTPEEQQALFAAALDDQELFDALAREQSLRDLLRDPAARAELLSALDTPASRFGGFLQWLRRPAVAGLAMAGVATIAVVAVWQGTRFAGVKPAPVMVAELRRQESVPMLPSAETPAPASQSELKQLAKVAEAPAAAEKKMKDAIAAPFPATAPPPAANQPLSGRRAEADAAALATPPAPARQLEAGALEKSAGASATMTADKRASSPPPPPPPALMARKAETESTAAAQTVGAISGAIKEKAALDARALFYGNLPAPGVNAFVESSGAVGGAVPPARAQESRADAAPRAAKAVSGLAAPAAAPASAPAPRLGVRIGVLRSTGEVDLTTVLDPGETVHLKLTPNADGFLYVAEGARVVASGVAERLKPFETPELRFQGSGQKLLYVVLSRRPWNASPLSLGTLARDNLVEGPADQDRATYVVSGPREAASPQVVVPVTLTYR